MGVYHGRSATLAQQLETTYRTPPGSPNTKLMKFSKITMGREADLADDPTINADPLAEKRDEMDSTGPMSLEAILCLNDIGVWLTMLLGPPSTTGTGTFTHTFTLDLTDRPSALLELAVSESTPSTRRHRHLGVMLNSMEWDVRDAAQDIKCDFIGAIEVRPYPSSAFDATPAALQLKNRACSKNGRVWDGAASIGDIAKATVKFENDLEGQLLADGVEGFGYVLLGQPKVGGTMDALFTPAAVVDDALARTSKHLVLVSKNTAGNHSLTVDIPQAEFDVPKVVIETSKGIVINGLGWRAHKGGSPVTVVLVNGVSGY